MKKIKDMNKLVDELIAYLVAGVLIILFFCLLFYVFQIAIGFLVAISMGW